MKKQILFLVWLCLGAVSYSFQGVDFSGTWKFNPERSSDNVEPNMRSTKNLPSHLNQGFMIIKMTSESMALTLENAPPGAGEMTYILDGAEHALPQFNQIYLASWDKSSLVLKIKPQETGKQQARGPQQSTATRKYTLSADGKVLTVNFEDSSGKKMTRIYDRNAP
jgi:hypothetical protein